MIWNKLGHVFQHTEQNNWIHDSALTPTPFLLNSDVIRVYSGFRDAEGVSRIGYVDVSANDPTQVIAISKVPCLDIGNDGCFDDNGVILGDVIRNGTEIRMYYVGFQLVSKVKFLAYTGLAISTDGGNIFTRTKQTPIFDRSETGLTINAIHSVIFESGKWRVWYAAGSGWQVINGTDYPKYNIRYTESTDGINFDSDAIDVLCVDTEGMEYRIGRPSVFKVDDSYRMFYTKGSTNGTDYFPGVAYSDDGINWTRKDKTLGLEISEKGFDSLHLCYPRIVQTDKSTFCFYNGNYMGKQGFGVAELIQW